MLNTNYLAYGKPGYALCDPLVIYLCSCVGVTSSILLNTPTSSIRRIHCRPYLPAFFCHSSLLLATIHAAHSFRLLLFLVIFVREVDVPLVDLIRSVLLAPRLLPCQPVKCSNVSTAALLNRASRPFWSSLAEVLISLAPVCPSLSPTVFSICNN